MRSTLAVLDALAIAPDVVLPVPGTVRAGGFVLTAKPPRFVIGENLSDVDVTLDGVPVVGLLPAIPDGATAVSTHWMVRHLRGEIALMSKAELAD